MRKTVQNAIKICYRKRKCVSASGGRSRPQTPYRGSPRIPLGDPSQRRRAIEALEARAPQTVL